MAQPTIPIPPLARGLAPRPASAYKSDQDVCPTAGMWPIDIDTLIAYLQWLRTQNHQQITWTYNGRYLDIHLWLAEFQAFNCDCASCEFHAEVAAEWLRDLARMRETAARKVRS